MKSFVLFICFYIPTSYAFGPMGHRIVARVAESFLSKTTKAEINKIIGHEPFARISNYPDFIKSDPSKKKYSSWHYLSIKEGVSYKQSIKNKSFQGKALEALNRCLKELKDPKIANERKYFALAMVVHIIGDLHQPLHAGFIKDQGGNKVKLSWFGKEVNLHSIWDSELILIQELSFSEYASELISMYSSKPSSDRGLTNPVDWVKASRAYLPKVYDYKLGKYWEYKYTYRHREFLEKQMFLAGYRLALILNQTLK